jgi:IS1 family transposase
MRTPCTSASSASCTSRTCSWMNCARGCVVPDRCCGSGSPSTRAPRSYPYSSWVRAHNTWRTCSSTRCDRDWHLAVSRSLPVMGSISTSMRLSAHFGQWLQVRRRGRNVRRWLVEPRLSYGQVKKSYQRRKLVRVTHMMRLGTEPALKAALQGLGLSGHLNTAFIERVNLTLRHGIAALARRTWATSQRAPQLLAHLEWWRAYYHFVRPHQSLRVALVQPRERGSKLLVQCYRQRTKASAAGRTDRRWTTREMHCYPLPLVFA